MKINFEARMNPIQKVLAGVTAGFTLQEELHIVITLGVSVNHHLISSRQ